MNKNSKSELNKYKHLLLSNKKTLSEFWRDLDDVLSSSHPKTERFYDQLSEHMELVEQLERLRSFEEDVSIFVDEKLQLIKLESLDVLRKKQFLSVVMESSGGNGKFRVREHSLPEQAKLPQVFTDLVAVAQCLKECLAELQEYLEAMGELDACCWVIDPLHPTTRDNYRRIVIGDSTSIVVTVDCYSGRDMPRISALGPSALVGPLNSRIHQYADSWDHNVSLTVNLLNMIGLEAFPVKPEAESGMENEDSEEMECGICLCSRDAQDILVSVVCEDSRCRQHFHTACLYQWLSAVSSNVQTFNTIHGECPNCSMAISCPVQGNAS